MEKDYLLKQELQQKGAKIGTIVTENQIYVGKLNGAYSNSIFPKGLPKLSLYIK